MAQSKCLIHLMHDLKGKYACVYSVQYTQLVAKNTQCIFLSKATTLISIGSMLRNNPFHLLRLPANEWKATENLKFLRKKKFYTQEKNVSV